MVSSNKQCINNKWLYKETKDSTPINVNLPHSNKIIPYNYFDEAIYQFISYYEKTIFIPDEQKRFFISFDGVMTAFKLFINDNFVGEYKGGYIPHNIEITDFVQKNQNNKIFVEVDSTEREDIPPFGGVIDYLTFGGIYRDVWLYKLDNSFIKNVFFKYKITNHNGVKGNIHCTPIIQIDSKSEHQKVELNIEICGQVQKAQFSLSQGIKNYNFPEFDIEEALLWDLENATMYPCKLSLEGENIKDTSYINLGFREIIMEADKMTLNNKKISIFGLNRHQTYPYVGCAMPKRAQEQDAIILKKELGLNTVRTSHYPQSPHFLNKCDELGLMVLEETPGWQFISQRQDWREQVLLDIQSMIERDYNHPSIITWGVRINESFDDHELYSQTNALARKLDDTRPTSGVRYIEKSELLEDIYTMNDFTHDGSTNILRTRQECTGLEKPVPYIITEFCGHIFPTKKFDQEERIVEHALRHGRVQSLANQKDEILGAIGWCAFDYNTHFDFGSGDRICYHGVMDMFRIPKFAAATYKSQRDKKYGYVIEPLTYWSRGERDKGTIFPIYVFTNCDVIEIIIGGINKGKFSRQSSNTDSQMQHLKYPPFVIQMNNGEWGSSWTDAEFIGYSNDEAVISKKFVANPIYTDIEVTVDDMQISGDEFDTTRIEVKAVDQIGNVVPYINETISIETNGDIEVIGPKNLNLIGGSIAFWIRSKVDAQTIDCKVKVNASIEYSKTIDIELIKIIGRSSL